MHKKLGPLETWQWLAIGAAAGVLLYLYRRYHASQTGAANTGSATTSPTSGSTDLGPIDPTTGLPFASEGSAAQGDGSANQPSGGGASLPDILNDFTLLETLLSGLQQITGGAVPPPSNTPNSSMSTLQTALGKEKAAVRALTAAEKAQEKLVKQLEKQINAMKKAATEATADSKSNPGHTTRTHNGGKQSVSSSAPHSGNNHGSVAPPSHQRHSPHGSPLGALPHWRPAT